MIKKISAILLITLLMILVGMNAVITPASDGLAADYPAVQVTVSPGQSGSAPQSADQLDFKSLGLVQIKPLQGPLDMIKLNFTLPQTWQLMPGASLEINLTSYLSSLMPSQGDVSLKNIIAGSLSVSLNNVSLQTLMINGNESQKVTIPIPETALAPDPVTGQHALVILWDSSTACDFDMVTSVMIDPSSRFILPHQQKPLSLDLAEFPRPIYLENSPFITRVSLVVPDEPSQSELQAALAVAAGLGRMTQNKLEQNLIPLSRLDDAQRTANHLIFIGKISAFDALPEPLHDLVSVTQTGSAQDGVIQIAVSPWNPERVIISVAGDSEQAILKAGQALSSGSLITAARPDLVVIREVAAEEVAPGFVQDQSFAALTSLDQTFTNFGSNFMEVGFVIPAWVTISPEAYLDLVFNHSALIDYLRSDIIVKLNGTPIGSVRLSDTTSSMNVFRMIIPVSAIRNGPNWLELQADLFPRDICSDPRLGSLWITIFSSSLLHLPLTDQSLITRPIPYLGDFPLPFTNHNELGNTDFVVPKADASTWETAGTLAAYLGSQTSGAKSAPGLLWAEDMSQGIPGGTNLIVIGQPPQLPFLTQIADILPAALDAQGELSPKVKAGITFQVSPEASLGYLELAQTVGQETQLLAVMGNSEPGVRLAASALTSPDIRSKLAASNFAILQGRNLFVTALTPEPAAVIPAAGSTPAGGEGMVSPGATALSTEGQETFGRPEGWIMPVMVISILLMLMLIGIRVYGRTRKQH